MNNDYDFFFWLSVVANWCQIESYEMNKQQISNDDLMKHLLTQDEVLDNQNKLLQEQTNIYLKEIIKQNEEILNLLKGEKNGK